MSTPLVRPSVRALLRRDHPAKVGGGFMAIFGLMAGGGLIGATFYDGEDRRAALFFAGVFALFALGTGIYFFRRMFWIRRLTTVGTVVDGRVLVVDQNTEDVWYMIVGYQVDGASYRAWQGTGDRSRFNPGDTVRVLVDLQRPDSAWVAES
ncbi:MAG: hypothetical protein J0M17_12615 [Planctomycetes bacterium]|nr:hypothetical protein [Planctomycetota bacterium]